MIKWLSVFICFLLIKTSLAQTNAPVCNVLTKYGSDGKPVKVVSSETIDANNDYTCSLGWQFTGNYNYITISLVFKTLPKQMDGDLLVQFADNTSINVPLTVCNNTSDKNAQSTTCNYLVLDKYISAIKTKPVGIVVFTMADATSKAIDVKQHNFYLKNALNCITQ